MKNRHTQFLITVAISVVVLAGCSPTPAVPPTPTSPPLAKELIVYYWDGGMPQAILDAFTKEYGVAINYQPYASYAEAHQNIETGKVYDVVLLESDYIGEKLGSGLLAELNLSHIPNLRNVAVNFRDLAFDPGNRHSLPYVWGTVGLVVRTDLFGKPVTSWKDLWETPAGKAGIWDDERAMIGLTLRSLGYSANTEKPAELEAALKRLLDLKQRALFMEQFDPWTSAPQLANARITIAMGWSYDGLAGRKLNPSIEYILPREGGLLMMENLVIPANSPNKYTAELFINFMLRPEIAGKFVNETFYPVAVGPAKAFIDPAILNDPIVHPTDDMLANAELLMPLSAEVKQLYSDVWKRFMAAPGVQ